MLYAKKKFGQNFLKDENIKNKIIQSMPNNDNMVVEIGPGLGDLTKKLLEKRRVKAIEIDNELNPLLRAKFSKELNDKRLILVNDDVLKIFKINKSLCDKSYDLVANLPYYVATNIILSALKDKNCKNILVMVQKEVGEKFCAISGDKNFSSLAVISQSVSRVTYLFDVPKESFEPIPKITSAVVIFEKFKNSFNDDFANFLKIVFKQPRKTLLKNLSIDFDKNILLSVFKDNGIISTSRAHQIDISTLLCLFASLNQKGKKNGSNSK
jgi:16S rRNA (adenine1518-N6/adenine1519-N6)-dimethyltransferase